MGVLGVGEEGGSKASNDALSVAILDGEGGHLHVCDYVYYQIIKSKL